MFKFSFLALIAWPLCFAIAPAGQVAAKNTAILIGIGEYPHMAKDKQLRAPVSDARAMRDFLISERWFKSDEIVSLLNKTASADRIASEILRAAENSAPGDRVLIYFSGHGGRTEDKNSDEHDGFDEFLFASDFGAPKVEGQKRALPGYILDDWMAKVLTALDGRDVTLIIDACHSATSKRASADSDDDGVIARGAFPFSTRGARRKSVLTAEEGTFIERSSAKHKVWAAAAPEQYAWEANGQGIFTKLFLEGLRDRKADRNGNGVITSAELLDHTRTGARAFCSGSSACIETGKGFTPDYEGSPDDVVMTYRTASQSAENTEIQPPYLEEEDGGSQQQATETPDTSNDAVTLGDLLGAGNEANLQLSIVNGTHLKLGDQIQFQARTNRRGTLVIFDLNPEGKLHQLSPSAISPVGVEHVPAGEVLTIPAGLGPNGLPLALQVVPPTGSGQLVALLIEGDNVDLQTVLGQNLTGAPIPNARGFLASLAERLRRMQADNGTNRARSWSTTYLTYTIGD